MEESIRSLESRLDGWYRTLPPSPETSTYHLLAHLDRLRANRNASADDAVAAHTCTSLLGEAQQQARTIFVNQASALCESEGPAPSLRLLFELWTDCSERTYLDCVGSAGFTSAAACLINGFLEDETEIAPVAPDLWQRELPYIRARDDTPDISSIIASIGPAAALRELEDLGERLKVGVEALQRIGGVALATTPKDVVYEDDRLRLYHYRPRSAQRSPTPLLIVYALVNRPDVLDLQPDRSTIGRLLDAGIDIYLIDWGYPVPADRGATLDVYINRYIDACVDSIRKQSKVERVDMMGVCQGGTLSLCYAATHAEKVRRLIPMVTPIDFHTTDNILSSWVRELNTDALVRKFGNFPGHVLNQIFLALRPLRHSGAKYLGLLDAIDDDAKLKNFVRMERWIHDCPDQAGEAFKEFVTLFFKRNALANGPFRIGDRSVNLSAVEAPVFNIYATRDHIVPPAASRALRDHLPARNYSELAVRAGHIGIYVSDLALDTVPAAIADWLRQP